MTTRAAVLEALATVRDPELDESITSLGFVGEVELDGAGAVLVHLRLPTYFCAPNFAYLMVADARAAVLDLPDVADAQIVLDDHFASAEITAGVAAGHGFSATFPGLAQDELDGLRRHFRRKAFSAHQDRLARTLLARHVTLEQLVELRLTDLPDLPEVDLYLHRRAELGLETAPEAAFLIEPDGRAVSPDDAVALLRRGRTTRLSIEGNAGLCRALLAARYADAKGTPAG